MPNPNPADIVWDDAPAATDKPATKGATPAPENVVWDDEPQPGLLARMQQGADSALGPVDFATSLLSRNVVTPVAKGVAALAARVPHGLIGSEADRASQSAQQWVDENIPAYSPVTDAGKARQSQYEGELQRLRSFVSPVSQPITSAANRLDMLTDKYAPGVNAAARNLTNFGGDLLNASPFVAPALNTAARGVNALMDASKAAPASIRMTVLKPATADSPAITAPNMTDVANVAGIHVLPSEAASSTLLDNPSTPALAAEQIGGSRHIESLARDANKARVHDIAAHDLAQPQGTIVTPATLDEAQKPHAAVYDQVRAAVPEPQPVAGDLLDRIAGSAHTGDNPRVVPEPVRSLLDSYVNPENPAFRARLSNGDLMDEISKLRQGWSDNVYSPFGVQPDPNTSALGKTQKAIADALDEQLLRNTAAVSPNLAKQFLPARAGFAKVNMYRRALGKSRADIDPARIASEAGDNPAVTGGGRLIADLYNAAPRSMSLRPLRQDTGNLLSHGLTAAGEVGAGALLYAHQPAMAAAAAVGAAGIPPLVRAALLRSKGLNLADLRPGGRLGSYYTPKGQAPFQMAPTDAMERLRARIGQRPLALPAPGQTSEPYPNAAAPMASEWAARNHPGMPGNIAPQELSLAPDVGAGGGPDLGGAPLFDVLGTRPRIAANWSPSVNSRLVPSGSPSGPLGSLERNPYALSTIQRAPSNTGLRTRNSQPPPPVPTRAQALSDLTEGLRPSMPISMVYRTRAETDRLNKLAAKLRSKKGSTK